MCISRSPGIHPAVVLEGGLETQEPRPTSNDGGHLGSEMTSKMLTHCQLTLHSGA